MLRHFFNNLFKNKNKFKLFALFVVAYQSIKWFLKFIIAKNTESEVQKILNESNINKIKKIKEIEDQNRSEDEEIDQKYEEFKKKLNDNFSD